MDITATDIKRAEEVCIRSSMDLTKQAFYEGKLKALGARINDAGIVHLCSRANKEI